MVVLKWSKTLQDGAKFTTIPISALGQSKLCPWRALKEMLACSTLDQDRGLFQVASPAGATPLTDSVARKHFKDVSRCLGFHKTFTFHDFRCGGPLGLLLIKFPCRTSWPHVCGGIFSGASSVVSSFHAHFST